MKTVKDICQEYGLSQTALAKRFGIPLRTVQNWYGGQREPAPYVVPMMEEILRAERSERELPWLIKNALAAFRSMDGAAITEEQFVADFLTADKKK